MFFCRKLSNLEFKMKIFIGAVFSLFISLVVFAPKSYATDTSYVYGNLTVYYQICRYQYSSSLGYDFLLCGGNYNTTVSTSPLIDEGLQYFKLSMLDIDSNAQSDYNSNFSCRNNSYRCVIKVDKVVFAPLDSNLNAVVLSEGDNYYYRFSTKRDIFLGDGKEFYNYEVRNVRYNYGGLDSYLNFNTSTQYSCLDNSSLPCQVSYRFNHSYDSLEDIGNYSSIITSSTVGSDSIYTYELVNNYYDTNTEVYDRSAYSSLLYVIDLPHWQTPTNTSTNILFDGFIQFMQTDDFIEIISSGINPDDNPELGVIQGATDDANSSNAQLGGISIPIFNPISSWLVLFTDSQCIDISVIPGWFGLPSQHICSPWYVSIRDVLTPIISIGGTLLLFGYAIRWLNGSSYYKGDISG